jgi:DNA-binding GntR family transcriptional regulator
MGKLDSDEFGPPFQQVAASIAKAIADGDYAPGEKLPPLIALAEEHRVAVGTARSALNVLRDKGIVTTRAGSGSFVRSDLDRTVLGDLLAHNGSSELGQVLSLLREINERLTAIEKRLPGA